MLAANDFSDLLPGQKITSPTYQDPPPNRYIIDYVPPKEPDGFTGELYVAFHTMSVWFMNILWSAYMFFVELVMRIVNIVYDTTLFDKIFEMIRQVMPRLITSVWDKLLGIVSAIGIIGAGIYYIKGRDNKSITSLGSVLLLMAFGPIILLAVPTGLSQVNLVVTTISAEIMDSLLVAKPVKSSVVIKDKPVTFDEVSPKTPKTEVAKKIGVFKYNLLEQDPKIQQNLQVLKGIHKIDDALWISLVQRPYKIANFGSEQFANKLFAQLMATQTTVDRNNYLVTSGKINVQTGTTTDANYRIFTTDGSSERWTKFFVAVILSLLPVLVVLGVAIMVLICKTRAIGRAIVLIFDLLMSFWPGYGLVNATQSLVRIFASFIMALFYSVILAVFLAFWDKIQSLQNLSFGDNILIVTILIIGMWSATKGVQSRLDNLPGLDGQGVSISDGGRNELGFAKNAVWSATKFAGKQTKKGTKAVWKRYKKDIEPNVRKLAEGTADFVEGRIDSSEPVQRVLRQIPGARAQQQTLTPNLSEGAAKLYGVIQKENKSMDAYEAYYLKEEDKENFEELKSWMNKAPEDQIHETLESDDTMIPAAPPPKSSPAFEVWNNSHMKQDWTLYSESKKKVRDKEYGKYLKKKAKYEKSPLRIFRNRPKFVEPTQEKYLKAYQEAREEARNQQSSSAQQSQPPTPSSDGTGSSN